MSRVTLYTRLGCHLCAEAERVLRAEQAANGFGLELVRRIADHLAYARTDGSNRLELQKIYRS